MKENTTRIFVAVDLPLVARTIFTEILSSFGSLALKASWVRPENIHLTISFLGSVPSKKLDDIRTCLSKGLQSFDPFYFSLGKLGVFPNWHRPRVFWIGIQDRTQNLQQLRSLVHSHLRDLGLPKDAKKFSPHLTLARIKSSDRKELLKKTTVTWRPSSTEQFEATEAKLYKSQLTPKGSIYTVLGIFLFRKHNIQNNLLGK